MAPINAVKVFKDSVKLDFDEIDRVTKVGVGLKTALRKVPCTHDLQWSIKWYPNGDVANAAGYVSIFTTVTAPVVVKSTYRVDGSSIQKTIRSQINDNWGLSKAISHEELRPLFRDGKVTITCDVEIYVPVPWSFLTNSMFQTCKHLPTNFTLMVENQLLETHKQLLSFVSPIFNAMFQNSTVESMVNLVYVCGFIPSTVKAAVDFMYGHEMENPTLEKILEVLRFADKYKIDMFADLEHVVVCNLSVKTFFVIFHHAYACSKKVLLEECLNFFYTHQNEMRNAKIVDNISHQTLINAIKMAFDLDDEIDVCRHAHECGVYMLMEPLARSVAGSLRTDNFSKITSCAWDGSSDFLKHECAKFMIHHWRELSPAYFADMKAETAKGIMTLANTIRR
uniref:BTB domain-containing protein n=1 Tax=Panagrellus redivivus TaxID=6233 RepID=A0A7E4WB24_PANRE